jgi:hypothetical protein
MAKRTEWLFPKTAGEVAAKAQERVEHHTAREQHYQTLVDAALEKIKERGIIVEERDDHRQRDGLTSSYHLSGPRIDPELSDELEKANGKLSRHRSRRQEYERWVRALGPRR